MAKKKSVEIEVLEHVSQLTFDALPLLRKKLLRLDLIQNEHGLPLSHIQVLAMLGTVGTLSVSDISRRLGIAKPNITPLVDRLIDMKLAERQRDEGDRRVVNIVMMDQGYEKLAAIRGSIVQQIMGWVDQVSERDFIELDAALQTIVRVLSDPAIPDTH